ncbi:MAG: zinc transporter ZupT [Clostridia bacterium]|nr:zinc transporter ZupT [Clostridia bacterium]
MNNVGPAILMTALAGLSTSIGGGIAFFSRNTNKRVLAFTLGISAGVMLYVSFMELMAKAVLVLGMEYGEKIGTTYAGISFFGGMMLTALIDRLIPETSDVEDYAGKGNLMRTGIVTALALGIHNFPEGMATFVSALQSPVLAIPIVVAIAIHNIPEGIAVAVPVYFATGSKMKGFLYAFASGMAEPIGAIVGYLILMPFISDVLNAYVFAAVAGVMVFISVDELLPAAQADNHTHLAVYGLIVGMAVMALSLIAFM